MKLEKFYKDKKILVAGGTGMVGQMLVPKLLSMGSEVYIASMDNPSLAPKGIKKFYKLNLISIENCLKITKNKEIVFNLLGVTGSPKTNYEKPGSFMMSNLYCAVNLLYAAQINKVDNYLYTSTYGVYGKGKMKEENVWKTFPSPHDKYAGWAKRIGELQVEAYQKEFKFKSLCVVRPANIYGPHLNFNPKNSMVVASLIKRIFDNENPLNVWGDGTAVRDFVFSGDVADAILKVLYKKIKKPINIGSGKGISIKNLVNSILKTRYVKNKIKINFDTSKPTGDKKRVLDMKYANSQGIFCKKKLVDGLNETIDWYLKNKNLKNKKFNYYEK